MIGYRFLSDNTIEWWNVENPSCVYIGTINDSDSGWYFNQEVKYNDHLFTEHDLFDKDKYDYVSKVVGYKVKGDGIFPYLKNKEDVLKVFQSFAKKDTKEKSYTKFSVRKRSRIKLKFTI